jgi:hypothetical protein
MQDRDAGNAKLGCKNSCGRDLLRRPQRALRDRSPVRLIDLLVQWTLRSAVDRDHRKQRG